MQVPGNANGRLSVERLAGFSFKVLPAKLSGSAILICLYFTHATPYKEMLYR